MAKSDYLEDALLDHVLRNTAYTSPTTVYAALFTANPGDDDTGTEVTGGSYARQAVTFDAASSGETSNSGTLTFSSLPAATVTHIGVYDALTSGNLLYHGGLTSQVVTTSGSDIEFAAGNFSISED